MSIKKIYRLINNGENRNVEFKRLISSPEKIAKTMVAMANAKGGEILIGIGDKKEIIGIFDIQREINLINEGANFFCKPPIKPLIRIFSLNNKDVILVRIEESKNKPHLLILEKRENPYLRINEASLPLDYSMVKRWKKSKKIDLNNRQEKLLLNLLEKREKITLKDYAKAVNISKRRANRIINRLIEKGLVAILYGDQGKYFTKR